jgi:hypothetical protein
MKIQHTVGCTNDTKYDQRMASLTLCSLYRKDPVTVERPVYLPFSLNPKTDWKLLWIADC